jgi:hypothetical protein
MTPPPALIVFEPGDPVTRLAPAAPLGPWIQEPLEALLRAADPAAIVTLDLQRAPTTEPVEVAAVLWADELAGRLGLAFEIVTPDPATAELLDYAGVRAPVWAAGELPALPPVRRASAS